MADTSGMAEIRGINIDKLAKGFADEEIIMKKFCSVSPTSAREIRWYQKTAGFLDSTDTTGITASQIANTSFRSQPVVVEQSWTRQTSYVKKYFVESPLISDEDIRDCDIDILATNVRDLVRAVERQIDLSIYNVLTESDTPATIQTIAITDEWNDTANCVPISDLLTGKEYLVNYNYNAEGAVFMCRPDVARFLLNYLISVKGSSIPQFASDKMSNGVIMEVLGLKVVVSTVVTADKAVLFVPQRACTWKSFMDISSTVVDEPMIGKKIRVCEEGVAILSDPKAVVFYSNIGP